MSKEASDYSIFIENLTKTYKGSGNFPDNPGDNMALRGIDLKIPKGCIYGLLGPNGAGKSTLINILAGLTVKTEGKIFINGDDIDKDSRKTRFSIGVVPQEVVLDPFFSVYETLEYYAGYYGVKKENRQTDELLRALHLKDKKNVNSRRLSGGMKRRVLIAKALVHTPPILILDEPTAGVDVELRTQLWEYVRKLNKKGVTILLTTHYLEEAEELCDYIAIINHGKIIADKKTSDMLNTLENKQITLSFREKIKKIPESIKKFTPVQLNLNTLSITYKANKSSINDILNAVKKSKLNLEDISTETPDLEDIFKHLVGKNKAARK